MTLQDYILESLKETIITEGDRESFNYENVDFDSSKYIEIFRDYFKSKDNIKNNGFYVNNDSNLSLYDIAFWTNPGWNSIMGDDGILKEQLDKFDPEKKFIALIENKFNIDDNLLFDENYDPEHPAKANKEADKIYADLNDDVKQEIEELKQKLTKDNVITLEGLYTEDEESKDKRDRVAEMLFDYKSPKQIFLSEKELQTLKEKGSLNSEESKDEPKESFNDNNENLVLEGSKPTKGSYTYSEYTGDKSGSSSNSSSIKKDSTGTTKESDKGEESDESDDSPKVICFYLDEDAADNIEGSDDAKRIDNRILFAGLSKYYTSICNKIDGSEGIDEIKTITENISTIGSINSLYMLFFVMIMKYNIEIIKIDTPYQEEDALMKLVGEKVDIKIIRDFCVVAIAVCSMLETGFKEDQISQLINLTGLLSEK